MEIHRIAVISDTHGLLRPEVLEVLKSCGTILHAGDFDKTDILNRLKAVCPVLAVRGNGDREWAEELPEELETELFGFRIYMIHNRKDIRKDLSGIDIVVSGHSHKYEERREDGILYLNPGSCGPRRFRLPATMAVLTLYPQEHRAEAERIECAIGAAQARQPGAAQSRQSGECAAEKAGHAGFGETGYRKEKRVPVEEAGKSVTAEAWQEKHIPVEEAGKSVTAETWQEKHIPVEEAGKSVTAEAYQEEAVRRTEKDVDMHKLVKAIMKDVRAGRTVAGIAARRHMEEELVEEICRYYVTHPGVDVDGILDRMERRNL